MAMVHHKTWFPVILIGLTVLLGFLIYSLYKDQTVGVRTSPVTAVEYQSEVHNLVGDMRSALASAATDTDRVRLLEEKRDALLGLLVPGDYKDVHLEMVMTLTQWIAGFEGDEGKRAAAEERWQTLVNQYSWIE